MKALQYQRYGGPDQLREVEVPRPTPAPGQILVKVAASSVNPIDWKLHNGSFRFVKPVKMPSTPGFDIVGEIVQVGADVTQHHVGDLIYAMLDSKTGGADAEYAVVGEAAAAPMPAGIKWQEAAGIPLAGLTALQALRDKGQLTAGQRVLVVGASGGVGHYAVQIARALGAHVTGVCSTDNVDMVKGLGATEVIDYKKQSGFGSETHYDVVFDTIGASRFGDYTPAMTQDTVYVCTLPNLSLIAHALVLPVYSKRRIKMVMVNSSGEDLKYLTNLVEQNKLRTVIDRVFPLEELHLAHELNQQGRTAGKIIVNVGNRDNPA